MRWRQCQGQELPNKWVKFVRAAHPTHKQLRCLFAAYHGVRLQMQYRSILFVALVIFFAEANAEYSVVIGQGIKVDGESSPIGDGWTSAFVWLIDARRTVVGPPVKGKLHIIAASHAQPKDSYLRTVQLFVLAPIVGDTESSGEPMFSLVTSSPIYRRGRYCIPFKPSEVGIPLGDGEVERNEHDYYCFSRSSLLKAGTRISAL